MVQPYHHPGHMERTHRRAFCLNDALLFNSQVSKNVVQVSILEFNLSVTLIFFHGGGGEDVEIGALNSPGKKQLCYEI